MIRSLFVKIPTLVACAVLLATGHPALAIGALGVGMGLMSWGIFAPNASLWLPVRWRARAPRNAVALTFDDGPDPRFTPRVLEILREKAAPATFFVVGHRVLAEPATVAHIHAAGHLVGNHSQTHDLKFHFRLWSQVRAELDRCNAAIRAAIGETPRLFRSPQGFHNPALGDVLRASGMVTVGWQVRAYDAIGADAATIERRILDGVKPGGVVLLHDGAGLNGSLDRTPTIEALPRIIDGLRARGLAIVPLDELLDERAYVRERHAPPLSDRQGELGAPPHADASRGDVA